MNNDLKMNKKEYIDTSRKRYETISLFSFHFQYVSSILLDFLQPRAHLTCTIMMALCMQDMYQNISKQVCANRDLRFVREKNSESFYPLMKSEKLLSPILRSIYLTLRQILTL